MTSKLKRDIRTEVDSIFGTGSIIDPISIAEAIYNIIVHYNKTYPPCETCKVVREFIDSKGST